MNSVKGSAGDEGGEFAAVKPMKNGNTLRRIILDSRLGTPVRRSLFIREVRREQVRAEEETENLLSRSQEENRPWENLVDKKNGALIVLGSGPSVAKLDEADFAFFSEGFSIGINTWVLHPFIPDAYTYEYDPDPRLLDFLGRKEVVDIEPKILMLRPRGPHEYDNYSRLPNYLRKASVVYGRANLLTRRPEDIWKDFSHSVTWLRRHPHVQVLPDNGATVARMVSLGVLLGFRRIVLVGVDLVGTDYYWDKDPSLVSHLGISDWGTGQSGMQHETLRSETRPFPIDVWLYAIGAGLAKEGISLEVWSSESRLAHRLPLSPESRH